MRGASFRSGRKRHLEISFEIKPPHIPRDAGGQAETMILCVLGAAGETQNLVPVIAELKARIPGNMLDARRGCFPARIFGGADTMQHPGECQGFELTHQKSTRNGYRCLK